MKGNFSFTTEYGTVKILNEGRTIVYELHDSVKKSPHAAALSGYVNYLYTNGVDRINADHISADYLDRSLDLSRGKRRLDLVYVKNNRTYECELKTHREVALHRTYKQVKEQARYCQTLILLVPRDQIEFVTMNLKNHNINNVVVDTYEY